MVNLRFLLDSNVISEPTRPFPNPGVLRRMREHQDKMGIAVVVWHELLFGCERLPPSRNRSAIESYLFGTVRASLPILPYDQAAAKWHASERARLVAAGRTPSFADGQIAAIAKANDLVLVTANLSHFQPFV
ncbi:MAG TPA: type II toxin-antitoxin system VapC family toxin, partial [Thermoanaerobaculia bacterium]|nr:type II toxin-antitoxin system VapC family toxin [Thermoanaerobaculia bacterium]